MNAFEFMGRIDRVQNARPFKIVASIAVLVLAIGAIIYYAVDSSRRAKDMPEATPRYVANPEAKPSDTKTSDGKPAPKPDADKTESAKGDDKDKPATEDPTKILERQQKANAEIIARVLNDLRAKDLSIGSFALGVGVGTAVLLAIIWLGLLLTYAGIFLFGAVVAGIVWALALIGFPGAAPLVRLWPFALGCLLLGVSFASLMQALRVLLSPSHPVFAIARNVVAEAVRMKISLLFIALLVIGLALLPQALDAGTVANPTPLRYRVQAFLQYSIAGTSILVALLSIVLGVYTVASEQREKVIWQTMTKPVRAWHYVLGKWLGVVGVAAVLLGVSSTGIFLFTEYLRNQPAIGEIVSYVPRDPRTTITEDRLALEYQVLVGRATESFARPPEIEQIAVQAYQERLEAEKKEREQDASRSLPPIDAEKLKKQVLQEVFTAFLSVMPGDSRVYEFKNLGVARDLGLPVTFRYKVNAGANNPTDFYNITITVPQNPPHVRNVPVGQMLTELFPPTAIVDMPKKDKDGKEYYETLLPVVITNADIERRTVNPQTITFPPDGLEIFYPASSFAANFFRVIVVIWLKIAFLAIVGIAAATFLSFSVACLTALGVFFVAESSSFMNKALEFYSVYDQKDDSVQVDRLIIKPIARLLSDIFQFYGDLNPTGNLVEGRLIPWGQVIHAGAIFAVVITVLFAIGGFILQRRELATYSGH
ncbi:MAG: ABC transporter permease subunit [Phycisphaerales bacterium]